MESLRKYGRDPRSLVLVPLVVLILLVVARGPLGIEAGPIRIFAVALLGVGAVVMAIRYPAAFLAPVLFLPELDKVSQVYLLRGLGPVDDWTQRQVIFGLVLLGVFFRWISEARHLNPGLNGETSTSGLAKNATAAPSRGRYARRAFASFAIFVVLVTISYGYTLSPNYAQEKLTEFLVFGLGLFLIAGWLFTSTRDFRDFTVGTVIFGVIVAISSLRFSATGALAQGANPSHIGKGQVIGLTILLLLYTPVANRRLRTFLLLFCIPLLALGLVSSEARGPLFSLFLVLIIGYFVSSMRPISMNRRQMLFVAAALVGSVMVLSAFWFYGTESARFQSKNAEIVSLLQGSGEVQGTAVERLNYYKAASQIWLQHPVFGSGLGSWSMVYWHQDERTYPHNLFFEVLVEQGLAGVIALLVFLVAVFRQLRESQSQLAGLFPYLLPCLVYLMSIAMFSDDLGGDRFLWFWCGLALAACSLTEPVRSQSPESKRQKALLRYKQPSLIHE